MIVPLLWLIAAPVILALVVYVCEVGLGLGRLPARVDPPFEGSVAILIPAHNEAAGLARTLMCLDGELPGGSRVLVVADNCSDATAQIARDAGAETVERHDPDRPGKGFALAFGRARLADDPPDVVVVLDADCAFTPGSLSTVLAATHGVAPVQCLYLLEPDRAAAPLVQISNFAFVVKNLIRDRGLFRIGGTSTLTGTGMALPWPVFAAAPLASGDIVEDLGLSIELIKTGVAIRLAENAEVRGAAATTGDTKGQRRRWEHGYLATALGQAPGLIWFGLTRGRRDCLALGLHLVVPPLALLVLLTGGLLAVCAALPIGENRNSPLVLLSVLGAVAGLLTAVAWWREGRPWLAGSNLLKAPLYVAWKIPLYARFVIARETRWVRTGRGEDV